MQKRDFFIRLYLGPLAYGSYRVYAQPIKGKIMQGLALADGQELPLPEIKATESYALKGVSTKIYEQIKNSDAHIALLETQYQHGYVSLKQSFEDYEQNQYSSKTRTNLRKKKRILNETFPERWNLTRYTQEEDVDVFLSAALTLSNKTYQQQRFDAGLPDTDMFRQRLIEKARNETLRAYILWIDGEPASYMCLYSEEPRVLTYAFLGYDPQYAAYSLGTILHLEVFRELMAEQAFDYLDLTPGEGEHKTRFQTGTLDCVNAYLIQKTRRFRWFSAWYHCNNSVALWIRNALQDTSLLNWLKRQWRQSTG